MSFRSVSQFLFSHWPAYMLLCMGIVVGYRIGRDSWTRPLTAQQHVQNELANTYSLTWMNGEKVGSLKEAEYDQLRGKLRVQGVSPAVDNPDLMNTRRSLYFSTTGHHDGKPYSATIQAFRQQDDGSWYFPAFGFVWFAPDSDKAISDLLK